MRIVVVGDIEGSARMSPGCSPLGYGTNNLETIMPVPGNDMRNSLAIVCGLRKPKDVFMAIILARLSQWLVQ
jgi:hypothetical protein